MNQTGQGRPRVLTRAEQEAWLVMCHAGRRGDRELFEAARAAFSRGSSPIAAPARATPASGSYMPALRRIERDIQEARAMVADLRRSAASSRARPLDPEDMLDEFFGDEFDPSGYGDGDRPDYYADPD